MYWNFEAKTTFNHVKHKYKQEQLMEGKSNLEKFTEIERENRILLEKMHRVMKRQEKPQLHKDKISLNFVNRRQNYERINKENQNIYNRLVNKRSVYSRKKYASERRVVENRLAMIRNNNQSLKPTPRRNMKRLSEDVLDLRYLVLKQPVKLRNKAFLVEAYQYPHDLKILAFDSVTNDIFRLVLSSDEAEEFIGETQDYSLLLDALDIEGDSLTLTYSH